MLIIFICYFLAGICNGIMDSIKFHNSYSHWGSFWSENSWKRLYDDDYNLFEKIFGAALDGWHLLKYTMFSLHIIALFTALHLNLEFLDIILSCVFSTLMYIIAFKLSYK
jgi:hypothetical protein